MNVFKLKKQVQDYLVDIDKKYEEAKAKSSEEIHDDIRKRQSESVSFDQAAIDVLLERAVEAGAVATLVKGFLGTLDVK